jgi:predicted esterase
MSSRMAVSYPGSFRALAIHSASYATCSATCTLPSSLPADHPPTLFLHGQNDSVVPISSMTVYRDRLASDGHEVKTVVSPTAGHEWISEAVTQVPQWFAAHL